jgi:hypothetical protein
MHVRDYNAIALALLNARGNGSDRDSYNAGFTDGVKEAALHIAAAIAAHDPTFDREDFLKLTRGE